MDADTFEEYLQDIVMRMGRDAQGFLLNIVPIALRIQVHIVDLDLSVKARNRINEYKPYNI